MKPNISIQFCLKCSWLLRSAYMVQEILTTLTDNVKSVALQPSDTGGRFTIYLNRNSLYVRKEMGHFLEIKELKQLMRD